MGNRHMDLEDVLDLADIYAKRHSGCKKVSVGSIILDQDGNMLSFGANAAIPDLCKSRECLRIEKYGDNAKEHRLPSDCRAIHSEVDAICHLQGSARGGIIVVTRYPCEACARAIVSAGIKTVYYGREQQISEQTNQIFDNAGVHCYHYSTWNREDTNV